MSYDIDIGDQSFNYTYNLSRLFHDHMRDGDRTGLDALSGRTGAEAVTILADTFERIEKTRRRLWQDAPGDPAMCAQYDPPNGWGSTLGAVVFLGQLLAACALNPDGIVRVG